MAKLLAITALTTFIALSTFVGTVAPVAAQEAATGGGGGGGDSTTYDFEDDLVQGDLVRPDGENLMVRRKGARESLIRVREHFISELLKSVENL